MIRFERLMFKISKITFLVDEVIQYLPDEKAFGHGTMYCAHPNLMGDL